MTELLHYQIAVDVGHIAIVCCTTFFMGLGLGVVWMLLRQGEL